MYKRQPEGCASILWKNADKASDAADALGITAEKLLKLGLIDEVLQEPLGGAHRDLKGMAEVAKNALLNAINELQVLSPDSLIDQRRNKLASYGAYKEG